MTLELYISPNCEAVEMAVMELIATSGFDDNNNTENPYRDDWDNIG